MSTPNKNLPYRLAVDLGSSSLGWALLRLKKDENDNWEPYAIIKTGVRIFSDGRQSGNKGQGNPSLAAERREKRSMRRRRDRLLKRKKRMMALLIKHGFFPQDKLEQKKLETLNPYQLRSEGLDRALTAKEFGRVLFQINQRRGFKSNRKTDEASAESGLMSTAIAETRELLAENNCKTVGQWLYKRMCAGKTVRARYLKDPKPQANGKNKIEKSYDLYINRQMVEDEFDALWEKQVSFNPKLYNIEAKEELRDCLLFQRPLRPVDPGRCTLLPDAPRAPLALPSSQRFRIYQEVNNLRFVGDHLEEVNLTADQRNSIVEALEKNNRRTFKQIRTLLKLDGTVTFNLEDEKRADLKGNETSVILSGKTCFDSAWYDFSEALQNEIVTQILDEPSEEKLIAWLKEKTTVTQEQAEAIITTNNSLPNGYGSLSLLALARILPELKTGITYDLAVIAAGFDHHSNISHAATGDILPELPYYGEYLQRHVGFGTGKLDDPDEKRYGRIANPTVHIGLNQVRIVVNALIKRYGNPEQVVVEVARELKQSKKQRDEEQKRQATNQKRNERMRVEIAKLLGVVPHRVSHDDLQKMILWEELNPHDASDRRCPYTGVQISLSMLYSEQVEIEHILPYSRTLDDGLNNKTVSMQKANRIKAHRTPWEAKADFEKQGWDFEDMVHRVMFMNKNKRYRFGEGAYEQWLREDKDFLARALNDTRYLSCISREYLSLVCPQDTWVIPGQMTAKLRHHVGLNGILGLDGEKNRDDHRHHAVDACVIGISDRGLFQRFANANKQAQEKGLNRLVENFDDPWPTYRAQVDDAVNSIKVSHKPDHGYQGGMLEDTARGLLGDGKVFYHKRDDKGHRVISEETLAVIKIKDEQPQALRGGKLVPRHGLKADGEPKPYKGYKGGSNYCMEIFADDKGKWNSRVISTFEVYQFVRQHGEEELLKILQSGNSLIDGKPLAMRLMRGDCVRFENEGEMQYMRVVKMTAAGQVFFAPIHEANVDARSREKDGDFKYASKTASSLQKAKGRLVTISPIGEITDRGFKG